MAKQHKTLSELLKKTPITFADDRKIWDKQPHETAKAFNAFEVYRSRGTAERSFAKVARDLGKTTNSLRKWTTRFRWVERVTAWDAHVVGLSREAEIDLLIEMRARHIKLGLAAQNAGGLKLQEIIQAHIAGKPVSISAAEAVRLVELGTTLERVNRGADDDDTAATYTTRLVFSELGHQQPQQMQTEVGNRDDDDQRAA